MLSDSIFLSIFMLVVTLIISIGLIGLHCLAIRTIKIQENSVNLIPTFFYRSHLVVLNFASFFELPIQIPVMYSVYTAVGYGNTDVVSLFTVFFLCMIVIGTFLGPLADRFGRKMMCLVFVAFEFIGYTCFLFGSSFSVLMTGTVFLALGTSIYHSAFESLFAYEFNYRSYSQDQIPSFFSSSYYWSAIMKILCVVMISFLVANLGSTIIILIFFMNILWLLFVTALLAVNESNSVIESNREGREGFIGTIKFIFKSITLLPSLLDNKWQVFLLMLMQSFYEAGLFLIIFCWDYVLSDSFYQFIFKSTQTFSYPVVMIIIFLLSITLGTSLFLFFNNKIRLEGLYKYNTLLAFFSFLIIGSSFNNFATLLAILLFGISLGIHLPAVATLRTKFIPENYRCSVMCVSRVPSYLLSIMILQSVGVVSWNYLFLMCSSWFILVFILTHSLMHVMN